MTPKEYLTRARKLEHEIDANMQEACRLRSLAEKAKSVFGGETAGSAVEGALVRLTALEDRVVDEMHQLVQCKEEIRAAISKLESPEERTVLRLRYLCGKKWEEIAVEMSYAWAQMHRFHARALRHLEKMIHNDT